MSADRKTGLLGQHYCKAHQGNHSHYDQDNCTVCRLVHALRTMITAVTPSDPEQFPGQDREYLERVALPRARSAIESAEVLRP